MCIQGLSGKIQPLLIWEWFAHCYHNQAAKESELECARVNNDNFTVLVSEVGRCQWMSMYTLWPSHSKCLSKLSNESASNFALNMTISLWKLFRWFRRLQLWATSDQQLHQDKAPHLINASHLVQTCLAKHQITWQLRPLQPRFGPLRLLAFPQTTITFEREEISGNLNEIQKNTTGQLMVIRRTVWGPKVPTLKGTEASLSYVQCFLYLLSSINTSIFCIMWLDTFWTDLVYSLY